MANTKKMTAETAHPNTHFLRTILIASEDRLNRSAKSVLHEAYLLYFSGVAKLLMS
jgi:hypothetical protein